MARSPESGSRIRRVARERFGWDELRPGQEEVVAAVLEGRDALAVMATGYGKSAIYQIAGVLRDGPTVVVSPLIALQRDQVEAAAVSSAVSESARREALEDAQDDTLEFLFLAPEQFSNPEVLEDLKRAPRCDLCDAGLGDGATQEAPFAVGARVVHPRWGGGACSATRGA